MGGLIATVLTPRLTKAQIQRIEENLHTLSGSVEDPRHSHYPLFDQECDTGSAVHRRHFF